MASCVVRVLLRRPRIFAKVVRLLSNIFRLDLQFTEYRIYRLDKYKVFLNLGAEQDTGFVRNYIQLFRRII